MIYIILPTHNGLQHAKTFIRCLNNQTAKDLMVVCVDDGSTDGVGEWITNNINSTILYGNGKLYFGGSVNLAYNFLKDKLRETDTVLIVNMDRLLCCKCMGVCPRTSKEYLSKGIEYAKQGTMAVSSGYNNNEHVSGGLHVDWKKFSFRVSDNINSAGTTGLFMNGKDFAESGGFSKPIPHYWSDMEFVHRQMKKLKLIAPKDLIIWIDLETTGINNPKSLKELFNIKCTQNPIYKSIFILKHCPIKYIPINLLRAWYWIWRVL